MSREEIPDPPACQRNRLLAALDLIGVTHNTHEAELYQAEAALPQGYQFDIGSVALARLIQQPELQQPQGFHGLLRGLAGIRYIYGSNIYTWIHDAQGQVVGRGELVYRKENGELQNLFVQEAHRHQGLGQALVDERLRLARLAGITSLYMPYLDPTNTLRSYYLERGFRQTDRGEIVAGPNPYSLTRIAPREF